MTLRLAFQRQIFTELVEEDGLLVLASGLGLQRILVSFLQLGVDAQTLILLVNVSATEEEQLQQALDELTAGQVTLRVFKNDTKAEDRMDAYRRGGLISVTSRILVVDMLKQRVPIPLITGILVANAHKVSSPQSLEAFILRLYREQNKNGFLKAFSAAPDLLSSRGFAPLESTLKALQLRRAMLWPRFHVSVKESLDTATKVVELRQPMTDRMAQIQSAILECLEACLTEVRRAHSSLNIDQFTVENALLRSFDVQVRRQLDPVWHQISNRTKRLVSDLHVLRQLLVYLLSYDCVAFNAYLDTQLASNNPSNAGLRGLQQSPWMMMDAADVLFSTARDRVYRRGRDKDGTAALSEDGIPSDIELVLEQPPKWTLLRDTVNEAMQSSSSTSGPILVMVQEAHTCTQLREFLLTRQATSNVDAGQQLLRTSAARYFRWKQSLSRISHTSAARTDTASTLASTSSGEQTSATKRARAPPNKRRRVRGGAHASVSSRTAPDVVDEAALLGILPSEAPVEPDNATDSCPVENDGTNPSLAPELVSGSDLLVIRNYEGEVDTQMLEDIRPSCIIMYDVSAVFVRQVEMYCAQYPEHLVNVYFMLYENSVEEQRYLSVIRREKVAFEKLIHENSIMAIPLQAKQKSAPGNDPEEEMFIKMYNARVGGSGRAVAVDTSPQVVVDIREFRSSLPPMLHEKGLGILPCTLIVGDYVLSPSICVERKSISDLIGSFNSGRLYTQAEAMCAHYETPILLIEFDQQKAFSLQSVQDIGTEIAVGDLTSKLSLLTITFPKLRIIWSSSTYATADIFQDLKRSCPEPDEAQAASVGARDAAEAQLVANTAAQEMLRSLPGITSANYRVVAQHVKDMAQLCRMTEQQLTELIGHGPARQLHKFIHSHV